MVAQNAIFQEEINNDRRNTTTYIKNLEVQIGQITQQLSHQAQDNLPFTIITNPKEHNNISVVTSRRQKIYEDEKDKTTYVKSLIEVYQEIKGNKIKL